MKILHIETGRHLYGGALQVAYLLKGLSDYNDCTNVLICAKGSAIAEESIDHADKIYTENIRGDLDLLFFFKLIKIIKKEKPELIHLHSRRGADVLGGLAARICGIRCVLTRRVDNPENKFFIKLKYKLYDQVITISNGIKNVLVDQGISDEDIVVVTSAVDLQKFHPKKINIKKRFYIPEESYVIGVAAQLIERKGHQYLLQVAPDILHQFPYVRFLFFGKGPKEQELKSKCEQLGISDKVKFVGFVSDIENIFPGLDLLVHPAYMEGLGVTLIQAAACGIPVVAGRAGGIPEIIKDGQNGFLVPPRNAKALLDKVIYLLHHPDIAKRLGENGIRIAESEFSIDHMVKGNHDIYLKLTA